MTTNQEDSKITFQVLLVEAPLEDSQNKNAILSLFAILELEAV